MLKRIRRILAIVFFALITLLFLDFTGTLHTWFGWMAKVQFLPAVMALNLGVVIALILLTLIFGRIYCSVICPLGVMQDLFAWLGRERTRNRYTYSRAKSGLRWGILILFVLAMIFGIASFVALLAPYSSYGRIANNLFSPIYILVNNVFAYFAERADSYSFYHKEIVIKSLATFAIAAITFIVIAFLAYRNGRTYCNTICPVGTILGVFARFSLFKPVIDRSKCISCTLCTKNCKCSCIDIKGGYKIDYSRCVTCGNCIEVCNKNALRYRFAYSKGLKLKEGNVEQKNRDNQFKDAENKIDSGRRNVLAIGALFASVAAAKGQENLEEKLIDGGLADILPKDKLVRTTQIVPPGAVGLKHLTSHCTGCQLCITVCPNKVLRPSDELITLMQPRSSYEKGFCRPECTKCSDVCPAGAIKKIDIEKKSSIQIGHAVWDAGLCLPMAKGITCGNCARHCPSGAIELIPVDPSDDASPQFPVVNEEKCIGCGACEYVCPVRPQSAIYVEGHEVHREI